MEFEVRRVAVKGRATRSDARAIADLTSHNEYYVNFCPRHKKRPGPAEWDQAIGKKLNAANGKPKLYRRLCDPPPECPPPPPRGAL